MKICLRVDDVGLRPEGERDAELQLARKLHGIMDGRPYLAAVIAGILDAEGASWVRSEPPGMTTGLHGWTHELGMNGGECEFEGMGAGLSIMLIEQGLARIQGERPIVDFVPPRNALTDDLLAVCRRQGLTRVWGQPFDNGPFRPDQKYFGIFMPSWVPLYGATRWRVGNPPRAPVLDVLKNHGAEEDFIAIVVLHLTWEASFSPTLQGMRELVERYGNCLVTPERYIKLRGITE